MKSLLHFASTEVLHSSIYFRQLLFSCLRDGRTGPVPAANGCGEGLTSNEQGHIERQPMKIYTCANSLHLHVYGMLEKASVPGTKLITGRKCVLHTESPEPRGPNVQPFVALRFQCKPLQPHVALSQNVSKSQRQF